MAIKVIRDKLFVLQTKNTSYAFFIDEEGVLVHLYWGKRIERLEDYDLDTMMGEQGYHPNIDKKMEECSSFGMMRYKEGSMKVGFSDGVRDFRYYFKGYSLKESELIVTLRDEHYEFEVELHYEIYYEQDLIGKWRKAINRGEKSVVIERMYSGEFPIYGTGYQSINCNGSWADEFKAYTDSLNAGKKVYESLRGSSAHVAGPYFIVHREADEKKGDVYFGVLEYSGNFKVVLEPTPYGYLHTLIGISDTDFEWKLSQGECFETPRVYAGYSESGFGTMSERMSQFARDIIMPRETADKELRILYNSWEATTFQVNCSNQCALARKAADLGVELFVVDDGWFGERSSDHLGLGDWYVNQEKFPDGLKPLIEEVNSLGMDFGIWIEPEMVNANSDLYRAHPEWIYRYHTREVLEGRYQYMLDLTNPKVTDYLIQVIDKLLTEHNISYIKWDMNRAMGEGASAYLEKEEYKTVWVRHVNGFYTIIRELRKRHPQVEFEACASGGGRADYGCMRYFDEFWTSDNTDPLIRLSIQETYSLLHPVKYMRAWVTDAASNEERRIPLSFKMHCSMCGALGIGMDLNKLESGQKEELRAGIELYKKIRGMIQFGRLYRLKSCHKDDFHAVQYVKDECSAVFAFLIQQARGKEEYLLKLCGLDENILYTYEMDGKEYVKSGSYLMYHGMKLKMRGDYMSKCIVIRPAGEE